MLNIIVALKTWGKFWKNQKIQLKTDNMAVVNICRSGYTRDRELAGYIRNIWLLTAKHDIQLIVVHIDGKKNVIADLLSRWGSGGNNMNRLHELVDSPVWCSINENWFDIDYEI